MGDGSTDGASSRQPAGGAAKITPKTARPASHALPNFLHEQDNMHFCGVFFLLPSVIEEAVF